jgi:hypothetical protein
MRGAHATHVANAHIHLPGPPATPFASGVASRRPSSVEEGGLPPRRAVSSSTSYLASSTSAANLLYAPEGKPGPVEVQSSVVIPKLPQHIVELQRRAHDLRATSNIRSQLSLRPTKSASSVRPNGLSSATWTHYPPDVRRQYLAMIETGGKGTHGTLQPLYNALLRANGLPVPSSPLGSRAATPGKLSPPLWAQPRDGLRPDSPLQTQQAASQPMLLSQPEVQVAGSLRSNRPQTPPHAVTRPSTAASRVSLA